MTNPVVFLKDDNYYQYTVVVPDGKVFVLRIDFDVLMAADLAGRIQVMLRMTPEEYCQKARNEPEWLGREVTDLSSLPPDVQTFINQQLHEDNTVGI